MSRLDINTPSQAQKVVDGLYRDIERRIAASAPGLCPVDMALSFLNLCLAQTCGKCVPCRVGLRQMSILLERILDGEAEGNEIEELKDLAQVIRDSADCAIGFEAGEAVCRSLDSFADDFRSHIENDRCIAGAVSVTCMGACPAHVDIPGYIALTKEKRYADAVRLIR